MSGDSISTVNLCKDKIESSVLAYFLFENSELHLYEPDVSLFTGDRALVFQAMNKLIIAGTVADLVTLSDELAGKVSPSFVCGVMDYPLSENIAYHIDQLDKARIRREMSVAYSRGISMCEAGTDPIEIESAVNGAVTHTDRTEIKTLMDVSLEVMDDIVGESEGLKQLGIRCGIQSIDAATGGFEGGEFIVIAARPGAGKTSLAMNMARYFAEFRRPGHVFSFEMSDRQLVRRLACDIGSIDSDLVFKGGYRRLYKDYKDPKKKCPIYPDAIKKFNRIMGRVSELPIYIDDSPTLTIDKIYSRAKKAKQIHNIEWIIIDHLGLIDGWTEPGQSSKNEITRKIKMMAKDLNIPVFVLSQMNREIEKRAEKVPVMADLRDAGSIEQDADIIMFPVVPGEKIITAGEEGAQAFIQMAKNRRGATGAVKNMFWQGHYYRYSYKHCGY